MAILNYTTGVPAEKTIGEITAILVKNGAKKISMDYGPDQQPEGVTFCLEFSVPGGTQLVAYRLPCNYEGVLACMQKDNVGRKKKYDCSKEQAIRVSWRIVKRLGGGSDCYCAS